MGAGAWAVAIIGRGGSPIGARIFPNLPKASKENQLTQLSNSAGWPIDRCNGGLITHAAKTLPG